MTARSDSQSSQELILDRLLHPQRAHPLRRGLRSLVICVALLAVVWVFSTLKPPLPALTLWDLCDAQRVADWAGNAVDHCLVQASIFLLLGVVVALLAARLLEGRTRPRRAEGPAADARQGAAARTVAHSVGPEAAHGLGRPPRVGRHLAGLWSVPRTVTHALAALALHALAVSGLLAVMLAASAVVVWALVDAVGWSITIDVAVALNGLCLGPWLAWWAARGWYGGVALMVHACIASLLGLAACAWLASQVLADQPYAFTQAEVTSADKRRLFDIVNETSEVRGEGRMYHVTEEQLNQLLTWWFSVQSIDGKAKVALSDRQQQAWCSLRLPDQLGLPRQHVNVTAQGECAIAGERLELDVPALEIGTLCVPSAVTRWLSRQLAHWINVHPRNRAALVGVTAAHTRHDGVDVFLAHNSNRRRRLSQLFAQLNDFPDVTAAVTQQLSQFSQVTARARRQDPFFAMIVRNAFSTARRRSRFRDPALENRAAILALAIALGHTNMAILVGDLDETALGSPLAALPYASQLRGRGDWPRHFWISAAIAIVASHRVSDAAGLLKEELDADGSGTGFSFADLAADRAGAEFARQATANRESARRIQNWVLGETTNLDELMPGADNLPEGLSDADLRDRFDGVGGARFGQVLEDIDARIRQLPWWTVIP